VCRRGRDACLSGFVCVCVECVLVCVLRMVGRGGGECDRVRLCVCVSLVVWMVYVKCNGLEYARTSYCAVLP
jgi:hypothetical protein